MTDVVIGRAVLPMVQTIVIFAGHAQETGTNCRSALTDVRSLPACASSRFSVASSERSITAADRHHVIAEETPWPVSVLSGPSQPSWLR
jgi:hypothetical protein